MSTCIRRECTQSIYKQRSHTITFDEISVSNNSYIALTTEYGFSWTNANVVDTTDTSYTDYSLGSINHNDIGNVVINSNLGNTITIDFGQVVTFSSVYFYTKAAYNGAQLLVTGYKTDGTTVTRTITLASSARVYATFDTYYGFYDLYKITIAPQSSCYFVMDDFKFIGQKPGSPFDGKYMITFEDIVVGSSGYTYLSSYSGFTWYNAAVTDAPNEDVPYWDGQQWRTPRYSSGMKSSRNVVYNVNALDLSIRFPEPINLEKLYMGQPYDVINGSNNTISITGDLYPSGTYSVSFSTTFNVGAWHTLNITGAMNMNISVGPDGDWFSLDNIQYTYYDDNWRGSLPQSIVGRLETALGFGPHLLWTFDIKSGTAIPDKSGYSDVQATLTVDAASLAPNGKYLYFNNTAHSYYVVSPYDCWDFSMGNYYQSTDKAFTIVTYCIPTVTTNSINTLLAKWGDTSSRDWLFGFINNILTIKLYDEANDKQAYKQSTARTNPGMRTQYAVTYNGDETDPVNGLKLYQGSTDITDTGGKDVGYTNMNAINGSISSNYLGDTATNFKGYKYCDMIFLNRELTAAQIASVKSVLDSYYA